MQQIPLISSDNQQLNVILANQNCTVALYERAGFFYLDLGINADYILRGILIVPGESILPVRPVFSGHIVMIDTLAPLDAQTQPTVAGLGDRYQLMYMTDDEYAQYSAAAGVAL